MPKTKATSPFGTRHPPNSETYYYMLFRSLIHSKGRESRLYRKDVMETNITDHEYQATESLIGHIGASKLSAIAGMN